jgi:hypothetical protein
MPVEHLKLGELLLQHAGLLEQRGARLVPTDRLARLVLLGDAEAMAALAVLLGVSARQAYTMVYSPDYAGGEPAYGPPDQELLEAVGAAGEEFVVESCRKELDDCGREDLVQLVQRVSLISDALGYDVLAPALAGQPRLLEVKTQSGTLAGTFRFYITRNEYEVGRCTPQWALVACSAPHGPDGQIKVAGWCRTAGLKPYLPDDRNGHWTEALVRLPTAVLAAGLPDLV